MDNLQGTILKGYQLEEQIGNGDFGVVYRASQKTVGREVAVKIILPDYANNPDFIRRFESEAQLVARLEHPHITPLHDFWRDCQFTPPSQCASRGTILILSCSQTESIYGDETLLVTHGHWSRFHETVGTVTFQNADGTPNIRLAVLMQNSPQMANG
jgi:serine/threonine protein kinase